MNLQELVQKAITTAVEAQRQWDLVPLKERINIWLRAADMMATKYRQTLNAATMLGQAKTVIQAEIDSAAELIDFIRQITLSHILIVVCRSLSVFNCTYFFFINI